LETGGDKSNEWVGKMLGHAGKGKKFPKEDGSFRQGEYPGRRNPRAHPWKGLREDLGRKKKRRSRGQSLEQSNRQKPHRRRGGVQRTTGNQKRTVVGQKRRQQLGERNGLGKTKRPKALNQVDGARGKKQRWK